MSPSVPGCSDGGVANVDVARFRLVEDGSCSVSCIRRDEVTLLDVMFPTRVMVVLQKLVHSRVLLASQLLQLLEVVLLTRPMLLRRLLCLR